MAAVLVAIAFLLGALAGWTVATARARRIVRKIRKPLIAARVVERHLQPDQPRRVRREMARREAKRR